MRMRSIDIKDNGEKYIWFRDDNTHIELDHGEILKDLIYIEEEVFDRAYKELIRKLKFEYDVEQVDISKADKSLLYIYATLPSETAEDKYYIDLDHYRESASLAGTILGYRISDDIRAVISDVYIDFLCELITNDLYNAAKKCEEISQFTDYLPELFSIEGYAEKIKELLLTGQCCHELEEYCQSGRLEMGFSIKDDNEIYYISALDQFIRLEIRSIISQKDRHIDFFECEVCKRLFARTGSGSYKKVRCSYKYKIPCKSVKLINSEIDQYKITIRNRVNKHFQRKRDYYIDDDIGWGSRAVKKIDQLLAEGKTVDEIKDYMEDTWWETVKKYGTEEGKKIDWSQF